MSTVLDIRKAPATAQFIADYVGEFLGQLALRRVAASGGPSPADLSGEVLNEELGILSWWLGLTFIGWRKWKFHPGVTRAFIEQFPPLYVFCSDRIQPGTGIPGEHYAGYLAFLSMSFPQGSERITLHNIKTIRKRIP